MKSFQDLNLCDDFLFKEVMRDEKLLIGFLEMVLDLKGKIKRTNHNLHLYRGPFWTWIIQVHF